jgi:short-subunit dehydrogenase involved in D-alanine esterification of teichoic acids
VWTYPKTIFSFTNSLSNQLKHIQTEVDEVAMALFEMMENQLTNASMGEKPDAEFVSAVGVELHDVCQSVWTMLHILRDKYGLEVEQALYDMRDKNQARGYYDNWEGGYTK